MPSHDTQAPTINGVLMMWFYFIACVWAVQKVMPYHGPDYPLAGYVGLIAAVASIGILVRSLTAFDGVRDNWRLAHRFRQRAKAHGTAKVGTLKNAEKSGLLEAGGWMLGVLDKRVMRYGGESSGHYFAPARVGKTLSVMANLVTWRPRPRSAKDTWLGSLVVVDWKGELAACTAKAQKEIFGRDVVFINPFFVEMNKGLGKQFPDTGYTGFSDLNPYSRDIKADVEAKWSLLLPEPPNASSETKFFKQAARTRGTMETLGLLAAGEAVTLSALLEKIQLAGDDLIKHIATLRQSDAFSGALSAMASKYWETRVSAPEQAEASQGELENALTIYDRLGSLGEHVGRDGFDPAILSVRPTCVYIMCPTRYSESLGRWVNWVVATMIEAVARTKDNRRVLFVIDEAARMGVIGNLDKATELYPSAGVTVWCIWQTFAAGLMIYGKEGFSKLVDNADVIISRAIRGREELKNLSEIIGNETLQDGSRNLNPSEQKSDYRADYKGKPLMDINDLRTLPREKQIIRYQNDPVYICDAIDPRDSKRLMDRIDPNPYHRIED